MTIRRCFCSIAFRDQTLEEIIPGLAEIGYDGVEVWGNHVEGKSDDELKSIAELARRHHLRIECLSPYFWFTNSRELHDESLERARRFVHYCKLLDCPKIRTFTDAGPTGIGSDVATEEHWNTAVKALQTICDYDSSILFVEELHQKTLADCLPSTQRLLQRVARDNFKILYHTPGWDLINDYEALKPEIRHMHLQNTGDDNSPGFIEVGNCDLPGFFQHIIDDGYVHSVSVEYCFQGATWEHARSAFVYLGEHLSLLKQSMSD